MVVVAALMVCDGGEVVVGAGDCGDAAAAFAHVRVSSVCYCCNCCCRSFRVAAVPVDAVLVVRCCCACYI